MDFYRNISEKLMAVDSRRRAALVAGALAIVAVTVTTILLGVVGHTKTEAAYCGYEDHEHTAACYAVPLTCDLDGTGAVVLHVHTEACYGPAGTLVCPLPEIRAHEHTDACYQTGGGHYEHDESCYEDVTTLMCDREEVPQHVHFIDEDCYDGNGVLICGKQETHSHGAACYDENGELSCGKPEVLVHVHDQDCYRIDRHVLTCERPLDDMSAVQLHEHTPLCYETVYGDLTCVLDESDAHVHGVSCYVPAVAGHVHDVTCYTRTEKHVHGDSCYEEIPGALVCGKDESEGHVHSNACYPVSRELTCGQEESEDQIAVQICGQEEHDAHYHGVDCENAEGVIDCGMEETAGHRHDGSCFSDPVVGHKHGAGCYSDVMGEDPICGMAEEDAHAHGDGCYAEPERVLTCHIDTDDGHEHSDACRASVRGSLVCGEAESVTHRHDNSCYEMVDVLLCENELTCGEAVTDHVHDATCRIDVRGALICTEPEVRAHAHGEACYDGDGALVCGLTETAGHKHGDACYEMVPVLLCENELACEETEAEGHEHDETCYAQEARLVCGKEAGEPEAAPVCGKDELVPHGHTAACYMDASSMHVHDASCYTEIDGTEIRTCGQLAASDCEPGPDGMVIACGMTEAVIHEHTDACFGEVDYNAEPACGKHVHDASCYKDPSKRLFGGGAAAVATCSVCGAEDIHVHTAGSGICGEQAERPVLACGNDEHEHDESCWTYYPDCTAEAHVCAVDAEAEGTGDADAVEDAVPVTYEDFFFQGEGYAVEASVPSTMFDVDVELRAERLEPGSDGWLAYMAAVGADPDEDRYMMVADIWFVDAVDGETIVAPDTSKGQIRVTVTAQDEAGNENSVDAAWGDEVVDGSAGDVSEDDFSDDIVDDLAA